MHCIVSEPQTPASTTVRVHQTLANVPADARCFAGTTGSENTQRLIDTHLQKWRTFKLLLPVDHGCCEALVGFADATFEDVAVDAHPAFASVDSVMSCVLDAGHAWERLEDAVSGLHMWLDGLPGSQARTFHDPAGQFELGEADLPTVHVTQIRKWAERSEADLARLECLIAQTRECFDVAVLKLAMTGLLGGE